jgi:hypothetical protein
MLAAQMAAIHTATMTFTRQLANVETIEQQDSAERALNLKRKPEARNFYPNWFERHFGCLQQAR